MNIFKLQIMVGWYNTCIINNAETLCLISPNGNILRYYSIITRMLTLMQSRYRKVPLPWESLLLPFILHLPPLPPTSFMATINLFSISVISSLLDCYIKGFIYYMSIEIRSFYSTQCPGHSFKLLYINNPFLLFFYNLFNL